MLQPQSPNSAGTVTSHLYPACPFQSEQPAAMIQTSARHTVQNAASFLDTGIKPGSLAAPAESLRELRAQARSSCCSGGPAALPCARVASVPAISRSGEAAPQGCDWQERPIPAAHQPAHFQGLGAALMSFSRGGDARRGG